LGLWSPRHRTRGMCSLWIKIRLLLVIIKRIVKKNFLFFVSQFGLFLSKTSKFFYNWTFLVTNCYGGFLLRDHRWQDHRATRCTHRPPKRQKSLSSELPEEGCTNSVFTIRRLLLRTSLSTSMLAIFQASRIWLRMVGISPPILWTILHKVVLLMGVGFRVS
jgi:hypothetical protein